MGTLIGIELGKVWRSRLAKLAFFIAIALAVAAAIANVISYNNALPLLTEYQDTKYASPYAYGPFCDWMLVDGFTSLSILFFLVAPLLVALAYSWSLRSELRGGWTAQALMRTTRVRYYLAKWVAAFVAGGLVVAVPLVVNFLVLACFVPAYQPDVNDMIYIGVYRATLFSAEFYGAPLAYVALRLALDFVLAGLWAAAVLGVSAVIRNRVAVLALPYVALFVAKYVSDRLYLTASAGSWRQSFTLFDLLRAHGDAFNYGWPALALAALAMLALSLVPPLLAQRRGVL